MLGGTGTSTVPRPNRDRTGRVPVVRFVNFSTGDTVQNYSARGHELSGCVRADADAYI